MKGEHVMTKCSLAERKTSCANPFSGMWGQLSLCPALKETAGYVQLPLWRSVPLSFLFAAVNNWTLASLYKQVAGLF